MSLYIGSSVLWYFADPMCSWCWGFSPVIEKIRSNYEEQLKFALMLGGLRPGTTESLSSTMRDEILHHWHEVHKMTGQSFNFDGALAKGFIYDTEPACRAVITVAKINPDMIFSYFKSIQSAFYVNQQDVTDTETLAELASQHALETEPFLRYFLSDEAKDKTQQHFQGTRQAGVTGFPSLVLQNGSDFEFIARGYRSYDEIEVSIEAWLTRNSG